MFDWFDDISDWVSDIFIDNEYLLELFSDGYEAGYEDGMHDSDLGD